ncbi:hypothetical protein CEXT_543281 [Caerostris extrusa]|uniref:Uncharacterized protein n=1 Tax=Caerostris extrusa TaxID=172846 RepID=A0AAV4XQU3_CAEEX|nr:hypothetical protein CEXT_543281 [Caerostris extrusa]
MKDLEPQIPRIPQAKPHLLYGVGACKNHPTRSIVPEDMFLHSHLGFSIFRSDPLPSYILQYSLPGTPYKLLLPGLSRTGSLPPSSIHSSERSSPAKWVLDASGF